MLMNDELDGQCGIFPLIRSNRNPPTSLICKTCYHRVRYLVQATFRAKGNIMNEKIRYFYVNENTFAIRRSVKESMSNHVRFDSEDAAKEFVCKEKEKHSKIAKKALNDKFVPVTPDEALTAPLSDVRAALALKALFEDWNDRIEVSFYVMKSMLGSVEDKSKALGFDHFVVDRWGFDAPMMYMIDDDTLSRIYFMKGGMVSSGAGFDEWRSNSVKGVKIDAVFVTEFGVHIPMTVRAVGMSRKRFFNLLPRKMMLFGLS